MKNLKLVVIYPRPKDVDAFEHVCSGRMRSFGWRERSVGPCSKDFVGWSANFLSKARKRLSISQTLKALFLNQLLDIPGETAAL
jgi:hypothetical protein